MKVGGDHRIGFRFAITKLRFLVVRLFHKLEHRFLNICGTKFLTFTYLPWSRNRTKRAVGFHLWFVSDHPVSLIAHL